MSNNLTTAERKHRGYMAEQLIEQVRPNIVAVEQRYIEWWTMCDEPEERERIWYRYQALRAVLTDIVAAISDGHIAEEEQANAN